MSWLDWIYAVVVVVCRPNVRRFYAWATAPNRIRRRNSRFKWRTRSLTRYANEIWFQVMYGSWRVMPTKFGFKLCTDHDAFCQRNLVSNYQLIMTRFANKILFQMMYRSWQRNANEILFQMMYRSWRVMLAKFGFKWCTDHDALCQRNLVLNDAQTLTRYANTIWFQMVYGP